MIKPFSPARVAPSRARRMAGHAHVHVHHDVLTDASSRPLRAAAPQRCGALGPSLRRAGSARLIAVSDRSHRCQRSLPSLSAIEAIAVSDRSHRCQRSVSSLSAIASIAVSDPRVAVSDRPSAGQRWRGPRAAMAHRCARRRQRCAIAAQRSVDRCRRRRQRSSRAAERRQRPWFPATSHGIAF